MRKRIFTLGMLLLTSLCCAFAQQEEEQKGRLIIPERVFFVPHWYVQVQGGMAYDVGESNFSHLISPAVQVSLGYKFSELLGLRANFGGFWARNRYAYPELTYKWNFIHPSLEADIDLTTLFAGKNPQRDFRAYAFLGIGVIHTFNNDDAIAASKKPTISGAKPYFQKLWDPSDWFPSFRFGLRADYPITDDIRICAELNSNLMSDCFNSKKGKNDNVDWHFNLLAGVKFNIGKTWGKVPAVYEPLPPVITPPEKPDTVVVDLPIDKISFNVNIYFLINQSVIRSNQMSKLNALVKYLNEHPKAFVRLSGFADKETGTPAINMRLSIERSQVVSQFLQDVGIDESRIRRFAKGDKVQPFDIPEDNRVCICFVYDPDNPVPQTFTY